ncbi:MAG: hypothetical protein WCS35_09005, partial [Sphaerochaeta sp.]
MENRLFRIFIWHCLPLLLVSLLFGLSATGTIRAFLRNENERQAHKLLVQTVSYFKVVFNEMDSLNLMFSENPEMLARLERLMSKKELSLEDYKDTKLIRSFLSSPANAKPYIDSVYVYVENQEYRALSSNNGLIDVRNIPQLDYSREFPKK